MNGKKLLLVGPIKKIVNILAGNADKFPRFNAGKQMTIEHITGELGNLIQHNNILV